MLYAKRGNRVIDVDETSKGRYLSEGYDIYKDGKIVEYGKGKVITLAEYLKVKEENESLKAEIKALKTKGKEPKKEKAKAKETEEETGK